MFCFAAADTKSTNVPKTLVGLIHSGLSSDSSFIRKASFHFLSKLWKIEENIIGDIHKRIENILQMETEAIVRREGIFEITTYFFSFTANAYTSLQKYHLQIITIISQ